MAPEKGFTPLDKSGSPNKHCRYLTGFTLVEIMIAVGIIGLLASIGIPNFTKAREATRRSTCTNNLRQIDSAKQQWAIVNNKATLATPTSAEVGEYMRGGFPSCPADDGAYTINNGITDPTCNITGHVLP